MLVWFGVYKARVLNASTKRIKFHEGREEKQEQHVHKIEVALVFCLWCRILHGIVPMSCYGNVSVLGPVFSNSILQ